MASGKSIITAFLLALTFSSIMSLNLAARHLLQTSPFVSPNLSGIILTLPKTLPPLPQANVPLLPTIPSLPNPNTLPPLPSMPTINPTLPKATLPPLPNIPFPSPPPSSSGP